MPDKSFIEAAQGYEVIEIVNRGFAYAIIVAGFLSIVFIFVGGISFILSGGAEEKIKQAVSTIRYAIIGLIVTVLAIVIVGTLGRAMGLNVIQYIDYKEILNLVTGVTSGSGGGGGTQSLD